MIYGTFYLIGAIIVISWFLTMTTMVIATFFRRHISLCAYLVSTEVIDSADILEKDVSTICRNSALYFVLIQPDQEITPENILNYQQSAIGKQIDTFDMKLVAEKIGEWMKAEISELQSNQQKRDFFNEVSDLARAFQGPKKSN